MFLTHLSNIAKDNDFVKVCFVDLHEIVVSPYKNMNHVCNLALCGSDK
jgi:hypothetical protein